MTTKLGSYLGERVILFQEISKVPEIHKGNTLLKIGTNDWQRVFQEFFGYGYRAFDILESDQEKLDRIDQEIVRNKLKRLPKYSYDVIWWWPQNKHKKSYLIDRCLKLLEHTRIALIVRFPYTFDPKIFDKIGFQTFCIGQKNKGSILGILTK